MRENLSITRAGMESQLRSTALYGAYKEPMMALGGVYNERRMGEGKPRGTVSSTKSFLTEIGSRSTSFMDAEGTAAGSMGSAYDKARARVSLRQNTIWDKVEQKRVNPFAVQGQIQAIDSSMSDTNKELTDAEEGVTILNSISAERSADPDNYKVGKGVNAAKKMSKGSMDVFNKNLENQANLLGNPFKDLSDDNRSKAFTLAIESTVDVLKDRGDDLSAELANLEVEMEALQKRYERKVDRDIGVGAELSSAFIGEDSYLASGFAKLKTDAESIYSTLAERLPTALRDGLVDGLMLAMQKAEDFNEKIKAIGVSFLQMIQRAFMESAASRIVGAIGGVATGATGGEVVGGSGTRDDVPAMLTSGEYVIRRSSVQQLGIPFLDSINSGNAEGFANGGSVGIAAPRVSKRTEYTDESKHGDITRYKTTRGGRGIDPRLSGYARENDRKIRSYYQDQRTQFEEDLRTKEQGEDRVKNEAEYKKAKKRAIEAALLGIGGSILISKTMKGLSNTNAWGEFANRRSRKAIEARKPTTWKKGNNIGIYRPGGGPSAGRGQSQQNIRNRVKDLQREGASDNHVGRMLRNSKINHSYEPGFGRQGIGYEGQFNFEKSDGTPFQFGGMVKSGTSMMESGLRSSMERPGTPALLTGGEYVMSAQAVRTHGATSMASLNRGSSSIGSSSRGSSGNTNNAINITVNSNSSGGTSSTVGGGGVDINSKELANKIKTAVVEVIQQQKRVGGALRQ
jgi:hypothetical protein